MQRCGAMLGVGFTVGPSERQLVSGLGNALRGRCESGDVGDACGLSSPCAGILT